MKDLFTWNNKEEAQEYIKSALKAYSGQFQQNEDYSPGDRIGYAGIVHDHAELLELADVMFDFWLGAGPKAAEFERRFANYVGVRYARLVNSGSSANYLAFAALCDPRIGERRILPGDEVITVSCGFPTTVTPILQHGCIPVFVDVAIPQYNIDVSMLEEALSPRTKAVMIAHTLGNPFDVSTVKSFCNKNGLWLIEDNCDALGSECEVDGVIGKTGSWGDLATSSFYPPHHMTMGEGGCVYTNNAKLDKIVVSLRDWGRDCMCPPGHDGVCGRRFDGQFGDLPRGYDHKYVYGALGYNMKVTELQAAVGLAQLDKLPSFVQRRKENWSRLRESLAYLEDSLILPEPAPGSTPSWFGFLISVRPETGLERRAVVKSIEEKKIQTRMLFSGNMLRHPCFKHLKEDEEYRIVGTLAVSDFITENTFWVGVYPGMSDSMLDAMADAIAEAVRG